MKKLVLRVEALEVETFAASASEDQPGTVGAQEATAIRPVCISGSPFVCQPTSDPHDINCVFQSPDGGGYGDCTPVCATYNCTDLC